MISGCLKWKNEEQTSPAPAHITEAKVAIDNSQKTVNTTSARLEPVRKSWRHSLKKQPKFNFVGPRSEPVLKPEPDTVANSTLPAVVKPARPPPPAITMQQQTPKVITMQPATKAIELVRPAQKGLTISDLRASMRD